RRRRAQDFDVVRLLGTGGYGSVFLVRERRGGGAAHAVKVVPKTRVEGVTDWMRVELRVLARTHHPNVVQLEFCLQSEGRIYVFMEYIRGCTLKSLLRAHRARGGLPIPALRFWFAELALALGYVHALGVIHRDVKPDK
ncbi:kinase-like domain-containing protein, partial [Tribonema minus]